MRKTIYKELAVYLVVLLVLAGVMHPDLFGVPLDRLALMAERGNYLHPFVYTLLGYSLIWIFRLFFRAVVRVFELYMKRQKAEEI